MAYDPLTTRGLIKVHASYREDFPVQSFLRDFFFGNAPVISKTKYVTIETLRDGQKVATSIRRGSQPTQVLGRDDHMRSIYEPPYFAEEAAITVEDLETFSFGETAENPYDDNTKTLMILNEKLDNFEKKFARTKELQAAEVLQKGYVTMVNGEKIIYDIDENLLNVNPAVDWDNATAANVKILDNLQTWALLVFAKSGVMPNSIVVTPDVHSLMVNDANVQKAMDVKGFELGKITAKKLEGYEGVAYGGEINVPGVGIMMIFTYAAKYHNGTALTDVLPEGTLIMANTNNMGRFMYAATLGIGPNGMPAYVPGEQSVFVKKADDIPPVTAVTVQMAPLAAPISLDTWLCANVLTADQ